MGLMDRTEGCGVRGWHREDMLKRELADMERRNQEAEARHEDLTGTLPDATRPLLRQIEGMQRTAAAHAQAWQMAEQALQSRLNDAEARAAAAGQPLTAPAQHSCALTLCAAIQERPT